MKDVTVRQLEMANRVVGFLRESPIAFRKSSTGADLVEQFRKQVAEIQSLTATQAAQIAQSRGYSRTRGTARESLIAGMEQIHRTAQAIAITNPGMEGRLQTVRAGGDAKLEIQARALIESVRPYVKQFVDFEMEPEFVQTFEAKIEAFTEAIANYKASRATHVAASRQIDTAMARALTILEQLDPIIENKLGGNSDLHMKWGIVRHIERRWIYKKAEGSKPETNSVLVPAA